MKRFLVDIVVFVGKIAIYALIIAALIKLNTSFAFKIILAAIITVIILQFYSILRLENELKNVKKLLSAVLFSVDTFRLDPKDKTSGYGFLAESELSENVQNQIEKDATESIKDLLFFTSYVLPIALLAGGIWAGLVFWDKINYFILFLVGAISK